LPTTAHPVAGLISAAPGKKNSALQVAARQVESMVLQKMAQQEVSTGGRDGCWCWWCGVNGCRHAAHACRLTWS
jgi:hypothetical protein